MLISDLSNLNMLRVVEREKLEEVMAELKLSSSKDFDAGTRQKLGKLLGAETILFGSYFEMIGQFRMDARIVKTETGEILKSEGVSGPWRLHEIREATGLENSARTGCKILR